MRDQQLTRKKNVDDLSRSPIRSLSGSVKPRGFTLLELLITLAILTTIVGFTLPSLWNPLEKSRLQGAARSMKAYLATARSTSIRQNRVIQFRCELEGSRCILESVEPLQQLPVQIQNDTSTAISTPSGLTADETENELTETASEVTSEESERADSDSRVIRYWDLPDGVFFNFVAFENSVSGFRGKAGEAGSAVSNSLSRPGDESSGETSTVADSVIDPPHRWSAPVLFRPEGRCQDAVIRIQGQRGFAIEVQLRGLTGTTTFTPPFRMEGEAGDRSSPDSDSSQIQVTPGDSGAEL